MLVLRDGFLVSDARRPSAVTVGVFDGLHRGHRSVIDQLTKLAVAVDAHVTVVTFDPQPAVVLNPTRAPRLIATVPQRLAGLADLGVEQVRLLTFDESLARESARDFVDRVLVRELAARCVVVGQDFRFGHDREGSVELLREMGESRGFDVAPAPLYGDSRRWSSTSVRAALERGDVAGASNELGRPFTLRATVVAGDHRGTRLGYPTANLAVADHQQLPAQGVYAGASEIDGRWRAAAISVGTRPQFYDRGELLVEVYLVDFRGDLYDTSLDVAFLARLRDQTTFGDETELVDQIGRDVSSTRRIFAESALDGGQLLG